MLDLTTILKDHHRLAGLRLRETNDHILALETNTGRILAHFSVDGVSRHQILKEADKYVKKGVSLS